MILVDGSYLYSLGKDIQPLHNFAKDDKYSDVWHLAFRARTSLEGFISNSVYKGAVRIMVEPAQELIEVLGKISEKPHTEHDEKLGLLIVYELSQALQKFDYVFKAELRHGNLLLPASKGAFDLRKLIESGESLFPEGFGQLFPDAVGDAQAGARCLAFDLYTASGFHFHRVNERVVLTYLQQLTNGTVTPDRSMGAYIKALTDAKAPKKITSCLRDLKDMHRNPLMHPDQSIDEADDAIALLNSIHTAITAMMKEISAPPSP